MQIDRRRQPVHGTIMLLFRSCKSRQIVHAINNPLYTSPVMNASSSFDETPGNQRVGDGEISIFLDWCLQIRCWIGMQQMVRRRCKCRPLSNTSRSECSHTRLRMGEPAEHWDYHNMWNKPHSRFIALWNSSALIPPQRLGWEAAKLHAFIKWITIAALKIRWILLMLIHVGAQKDAPKLCKFICSHTKQSKYIVRNSAMVRRKVSGARRETFGDRYIKLR